MLPVLPNFFVVSSLYLEMDHLVVSFRSVFSLFLDDNLIGVVSSQ
mgnify:CR=1 FL=1